MTPKAKIVFRDCKEFQKGMSKSFLLTAKIDINCWKNCLYKFSKLFLRIVKHVHTYLEAGAVKKKRTWNEINSIIKVVHQVTRIH